MYLDTDVSPGATSMPRSMSSERQRAMVPAVGLVGLGKLGLPVAVTLALRGHAVRAFDVRPERMAIGALSPYEIGPEGVGRLAELADRELDLRFCDLSDVVNKSDCVLIAVETPHGLMYEGVTLLPDSRANFAYETLVGAVRSVARVATRPIEVGIVSTVLPGTIRACIAPVLAEHVPVYCPQFVAMGTVAYDLCNPEFTLLGYSGPGPHVIREVFQNLSEAPIFEVSFESAELAKVMYNTFVGTKIAVANVVQQTAHEVGADAADVFAVLRAADRRLASSAYLGPGMGDGGPCHPRDNIAMSWLARKLRMGADLFSAIMFQRQAYVQWLCDMFLAEARGRPLVLLGTSYKPGVDIEAGSSTVLMANLLRTRGRALTIVPSPSELASIDLPSDPAAFFVGTPECEFISLRFPVGSVVVDPWHCMSERDGVTVVFIGRSS